MKQYLSRPIQRSFNRLLYSGSPDPILHNPAGVPGGIPVKSQEAPLPGVPPQRQAGRPPRILIVGAGLAGLGTAYFLKQAGLSADVFEASDRCGGRLMTLADFFGTGVLTELGGEYIDADHRDVLDLASTLQLELLDFREDGLGMNPMVWIGGRRYSEQDIETALKPFLPRLLADMAKLPEDPDEISYRNPAAWAGLDQLSIVEYLEDIGIRGWLAELFCTRATSYFTQWASRQSAINLFFLLGLPATVEQRRARPDRVYKIKAGNQALTDALAHTLGDSVSLDHVLTEIHKTAQGFKAIFAYRDAEIAVECDYLVLTLPFTCLRKVRTVGFEWSPVKGRCIRELGYGNGGKVVFGVDERVWRRHGFNGWFHAVNHICSGWDSSRMQNSRSGSLTFFGGGRFGEDVATLVQPDLFDMYYASLEAAWPGLVEAANGRIHSFSWETYSFSRGSYAVYAPGQWTAFAGVEKEPEGNILFAGEHCSLRYQGYMNGAVLSGRRAAERIVKNYHLLTA